MVICRQNWSIDTNNQNIAEFTFKMDIGHRSLIDFHSFKAEWALSDIKIAKPIHPELTEAPQ